MGHAVSKFLFQAHPFLVPLTLSSFPEDVEVVLRSHVHRVDSGDSLRDGKAMREKKLRSQNDLIKQRHLPASAHCPHSDCRCERGTRFYFKSSYLGASDIAI